MFDCLTDQVCIFLYFYCCSSDENIFENDCKEEDIDNYLEEGKREKSNKKYFARRIHLDNYRHHSLPEFSHI